MKITHKNHYVPIWYQKRFLLDGQTEYFRLDKSPTVIHEKNGQKIFEKSITIKGPNKFFYHDDLYTTYPFGCPNDEIEKFLFGKIDTKGAKALRAFVSPNWQRELHDHFKFIFIFMDAQKLRTPKGLSWIKKTTICDSQIELMTQMQRIRKLNCVTWCESVMEIVNANNSKTKFIVSDNPVTSYNPECYPGSVHCKFPHDPSIFLKGTRTIYPIDINHCFILTNLEYAKKQGKNKALQIRTNPRYFDDTITRYDTIIRDRSLKEKQVLQINFILKNRAHKYLAAAVEDWLYPEKHLVNTNWRTFDKSILPPESGLIGFGGEIFLGGKDGKLIMTQDAYGRKPKNKDEWEKKEKEIQEMKIMLDKALKNHAKAQQKN